MLQNMKFDQFGCENFARLHALLISTSEILLNPMRQIVQEEKAK